MPVYHEPARQPSRHMSALNARKLASAGGVALASFPLLVMGVFFAYVIRARLAFGHWPSYGNPESWSMGFKTHHTLLRPWFLVYPLALVPAVAALYGAVLWLLTRSFPRGPFIALGVSTVILYGWLCTDPGRFIEWFRD